MAAAADWLVEAFGFVLRWRAGGHRAQLAVGDGCIVAMEPSEPFPAPGDGASIADEDPASWGATLGPAAYRSRAQCWPTTSGPNSRWGAASTSSKPAAS